MAKEVKFHSEGIGLVPTSADPASPAQGQLQYSDGTARAEGLWKYDGTSWTRLGGSGGIISDWIPFTPTGSWSNVTYSGKYRRVGGQIELQYLVTCLGVPTGTVLTFDPPAGISVDSSQLTLLDGTVYPMGEGEIWDSPTTIYQASGRYIDTSDVIRPQALDTGAAATRASSITPTTPFVFGVNDGVSFNITLPIQGWETGVLPNEISEGKLHTMIMTGSGTTSLTNQVTTKLTNWATPSKDESASWDAVNSRYVAQETGTYSVSASARVSDVDNDLRRLTMLVFVNGVFAYGSPHSDVDLTANASSTKGTTFNRLIELTKDDYVEINLFQDNTDGDTLTTEASVVEEYQHFTVTKLNNLASQITPAETVAMRATTDTAQFVGGTITGLAFEDVDYDLTGSFVGASGQYTVPISGKYFISTGILFQAATYAANQGLTVEIRKNGVTVNQYFKSAQSAGSKVLGSETNAVLNLVAGDVINIGSINQAGGNLNTSALGTANYLSIVKVGN